MAHDPTRPTKGAFPDASDPSLVGTWPALTRSGGGYFYDDVLEYRVWVHPERGGEDLHDGEDYFLAFDTHDAAAAFSARTAGAEEPLVLIRQLEWINEPKPGVYEHRSGERITEWQVDWLADSHRGPESIRDFLREHASGP